MGPSTFLIRTQRYVRLRGGAWDWADDLPDCESRRAGPQEARRETSFEAWERDAGGRIQERRRGSVFVLRRRLTRRRNEETVWRCRGRERRSKRGRREGGEREGER